MDILFIIVGLTLIIKKETKITTKRSISGNGAKLVGLIFILPIILSYGFLLTSIFSNPQNFDLWVNIFINLKYAGFMLGFVTAFYLVFLHKNIKP